MKFIASLLALAILAACSAEPAETSESSKPETETVKTDGTDVPAEEPDEPEEPQAPAMGDPKFVGQEGWVEEKTTSDMRHAQYRLPKVEGDAKDTEVVVFWFNGGGGDVEMNFTRWASQFSGPDGSPVVSRISDFMVKGRRVDLIQLEGTYGSGMGTAGGPGTAMVGAIVETEKGPYFCRLLGPKKSVEKWKDSYMTFLKSVY